MAKETWGGGNFSPAEWAELEEEILLSEAEYERGELWNMAQETRKRFWPE